MSDGDTQIEGSVHIVWTDYASRKLSARVKEFKRRDRYFEPDELVDAIQFLRGCASRAGYVLPALYMAIGARTAKAERGMRHAHIVRADVLEQSALQTIALACRSIFDDRKGRLSGKKIAVLDPVTLSSVAKYWSERSGKLPDDASKALAFLQRIFERCARPAKNLIDQPSLLERRIGLLKYYAHRQAAHISLEDYLFDVLDVVHVVAAITLLGAVILEFDDPLRADGYFDSIDESGWLNRPGFPGGSIA